MAQTAVAPIVENPLSVLAPKIEPRLYTLYEYLEREEKSNARHNYYDGKIKKLPIALISHGVIAGNLIFRMNLAAERSDKNYIVSESSAQVYLPTLNRCFYTEGLVVAEEHKFL